MPMATPSRKLTAVPLGVGILRCHMKRLWEHSSADNSLATFEMMKCDFWKAINTHCNDGRSSTD